MSTSVSKELPEETLLKIMNIFKVVDRDKSGLISTSELQQALKNTDGSEFSEDICKLLIKLFDGQNKGAINAAEFELLYTFVKEWLHVFETYDTNSSGSIEEKELYAALLSMGFKFSKDFVRQLMLYNNPKTDKINVDQFIKTCINIQRSTKTFQKVDHKMNGIATIEFENFVEVMLELML